jgi:hypothetical protein
MITTVFYEHLYDNRQTCSCNKSFLADSLLITTKHFAGLMKIDQGEELFSENHQHQCLHMYCYSFIIKIDKYTILNEEKNTKVCL